MVLYNTHRLQIQKAWFSPHELNQSLAPALCWHGSPALPLTTLVRRSKHVRKQSRMFMFDEKYFGFFFCVKLVERIVIQNHWEHFYFVIYDTTIYSGILWNAIWVSSKIELLAWYHVLPQYPKNCDYYFNITPQSTLWPFKYACMWKMWCLNFSDYHSILLHFSRGAWHTIHSCLLTSF